MLNEAILFGGAWVATNLALHINALNEVFDKNAPIQKPPDTVSIILPAYKEPERFTLTALQSLKHQNIVHKYPSYFEFIFVDGVDYIHKIKPLVDLVLHPQPGKLHARAYGIAHSSGNIIVAVDADTYYPPNWLNMVLKPFQNPRVVGVTTTKSLGIFDLIGGEVLKHLYYSQVMLGRGSAFKKSAYKKVGGFDTSKDKGDINTLQAEEELKFMDELSKIGKVVVVNAPVFHLGEETSFIMKSGRGLH